MESRQRIDEFLNSVRQRLHLRRLAAVAARMSLAVATVMLFIALVYVGRGYAVPWVWYGLSAGLGTVLAVAAWLILREDADQTASFADRFFGLQDALLSWLHFHRRQRSEGFYVLQAEQTARSVQSLNAGAVEWRPPRRVLAAAIVVASIAVALGFKGPSQAVLQQVSLEEMTLAQTVLINRDLQELVRDLDAQTENEAERDLLNPDRLREMVDSLRQTKDQKEALRQYARLESELQKMRAGLEQRRDERLLAEAARELQNDRQTRPFAEQISQQQYKEAAQQLNDWKPDNTRSLSEQQKQLARLRAASQRMAAAAKNQRGSSGSESANRAEKGQSSTAQSGSSGGASGAASGAQGAGSGELAQAIESLANSVKQLDEALQRAARQERETGQCDANTLSQCQACQDDLEKDLERLARHLTKMGVRCDAAKKLAALCKACSQCQAGLCQSQCASPNAGGKDAGWGSNLARRDVIEDLVDHGQTTSLQGIKGEGPSQTTVETAEDGTGTSGRAAVAKQRSFQKHFESFVNREDVPEQVKAGVKNYFQSIHQIEDTP